jgi:hypothetical protein
MGAFGWCRRRGRRSGRAARRSRLGDNRVRCGAALPVASRARGSRCALERARVRLARIRLFQCTPSAERCCVVHETVARRRQSPGAAAAHARTASRATPGGTPPRRARRSRRFGRSRALSGAAVDRSPRTGHGRRECGDGSRRAGSPSPVADRPPTALRVTFHTAGAGTLTAARPPASWLRRCVRLLSLPGGPSLRRRYRKFSHRCRLLPRPGVLGRSTGASGGR